MRDGDFLKLHEALCHEAREIAQAKGHDYSGAADTLRSKRVVETVLSRVSAPDYMLGRLAERLARLDQLLAPGASASVKEEGIRASILDGINEFCLLAALVAEGKDDAERARPRRFGHQPVTDEEYRKLVVGDFSMATRRRKLERASVSREICLT